MPSPEAVGLITLAIEIVGFVGGGIVIYIMKRQIAAQAETLNTFAELNKAALAMATAVDPKKYTDLVNAYQELSDKTANATVDDARREFQREQQQTEERAKKAIELLLKDYAKALKASYKVLAYVPPVRRDAAINAADVPQDIRQDYLDMAATAPDLSSSPPLGLGDFATYQQTLASALRIDVRQGPLPLRIEAADAPPPAAPPPRA